MCKETQEAISNIIRTFSGAHDGGVKFFKFKMVSNSFDKQAEKGDEKTIEFIKIIKRFSKLLNICEQIFDEQVDKKERDK